MKVTVSITTYNQAPFIRQAIESVLMQQTGFDFEILIGEDESSDGTREIVREYAAKHPGKIRVIYNERKNVIHYKGKPTGRYNFLNNIKKAGGNYVALLEGDDYWTDPRKLQKQVDHLDGHPQHSVCFHDMLILYEDSGKTLPYPVKVRQPIYSLEQFLEGWVIPHTASVMFRNGLIREFPDWMLRLGFGDLPLLTMLGESGDFGFLGEVMGVYRKHKGGIWTSGLEFTRWSNEVAIERFLAVLEYNETLKQHLPARFSRVLRKKIAEQNYELVWLFQCQKDYPKMREHLWRAFRAQAFHPQFRLGFVARSSLIAFLPFLYRLYQSVKNLCHRPAAAESGNH